MRLPVFNRMKDRLYTIEVVLDAVMTILDRKDMVTREEVQMEILRSEDVDEDEVDR